MSKLHDAYLIGGGATKQIPLSELERFFPTLFGSGSLEEPTVQFIYRTVSYAFRALRIRANAFVEVPWEIRRIGGEADDVVEIAKTPYADVNWRWLLWRTCAARLMWGASYWLKLPDDLQWLNPVNMRVETHPLEGIIAFIQELAGGTIKKVYKPEEIVYVPEWNPEDDLGPGIAAMRVALTESALVANADEYLAKFFAHGAIPSVILSTDSNVPDAEIERVRSVWQRLYSSVANAWRTAVLRKGLKPTVVGQNIKDLAFTELMDTSKGQIAVDFGLSITLLDATASNFATAKQDDINLYTKTVFPDQRIVTDFFNTQLWTPLGYEWVWRYDQVEAIQADEAEKASGTAELLEEVDREFQSGILTRDRAVYLSEQLWAQMGLEIPEDIPDKEPEEEELAPEAPQTMPAEMVEQQEVVAAAANRSMWEPALRRWRRKAKKRGKACDFESDLIPDWMAVAVKGMMARDLESAFDPWLKQAGLQLALERRLQRAIAAIYAQHLPAIEAAIAAGGVPDLSQMYTEIRSAVEPIYEEAIIQDALGQAGEFGYGPDFDKLLEDAADWSQREADRLIEQISGTDQRRMQVVLDQLSAGTLEVDAVDEALARTFGDTRASLIATTEVTAALHQASIELQQALAVQNIETIMRWLTQEDERVCPVCGPLDQTLQGDWGENEDGPPAHHNCRCRTAVEVVREAG